ncbi:MAG TPA: response regulator transcription factor [Gemmatimonadales bacterium]|nr:response regulator transcription factor [Gemmatimonadales bacterium]
MRTRLVLADRHPIVLYGLEQLLRAEPDLQVVACSTSGDETLTAIRRHQPDLLLIDVRLPRKNGLQVVRELQREQATTKVVLMADRLEDDEVLEAYRLGVRDILLKELALEKVVQCVRTVRSGEPWIEKRAVSRALDVLLKRESGTRAVSDLLTRRELETVRLAVLGLRTGEISARLGIKAGTVKTHLHRAYDKLKVNNRVALTRYAQSLKLV